jgi:hypothetical protein
VAERQLPKLNVAGSIPVSRSNQINNFQNGPKFLTPFGTFEPELAQGDQAPRVEARPAYGCIRSGLHRECAPRLSSDELSFDAKGMQLDGIHAPYPLKVDPAEPSIFELQADIRPSDVFHCKLRRLGCRVTEATRLPLKHTHQVPAKMPMDTSRDNSFSRSRGEPENLSL